MNINEGRNYFPSSNTENLVEKLLINRHNPGTLQVQQNAAYAIGDNKVSTLNQAVQGGVNIMNLQVNGPVRVKDPVPQRNRVLTKFENKRRDTENKEALYNIRQADDNFVYGNYLNQQLSDKAKQKVFNKPSITFREQMTNTQTFGEFQNMASNIGMNTFDLDFKDADDSGVLRFNQDNIGSLGISKSLGVSNTTASSMSPGHPNNYNPLLLTSPENKYDQRYGPALPDERITFYTGERPYITKGERQLQARELATSEYVKERMNLQQIANDASNKTPHNPRAGVAEFKRGLLNVQPVATESFVGNKFDREGVNENFVDRVNLTTDGGLERMRDIQQQIEFEESPAIAEIKSKQFDKNVVRKIHSDNGDHKLFGNDSRHAGVSIGLGGLYETFKSFVSKDKLLNDIAIDETKKRKQGNYKNNIVSDGAIEEFELNIGTSKELDDLRYKLQKDYKGTNNYSRIENNPDYGLQTEKSLEDTRYKNKSLYKNKLGSNKIEHPNLQLGLESVKDVEDARIKTQKDYKQPSLAKRFIDSIKSGLGLETEKHEDDIRYETQTKIGYTEDVFEDMQLRERLQELEKRKNDFDINNGKYIVVNNGRIKDFKNDVGYSENVVEPMSLLTTDDGVIVRSLVVKENDVCKIIQVRQSGDFKDYAICTVPTEMLEGILGHELKIYDNNNSRFNNVVGLNPHEHVAINIIIEEMPDKLKLESARPLSIYHRDILDSSIPKIGCITETKILQQQINNIKKENLRIDGNLSKRQQATERTNNEQRVIQTQTLKENDMQQNSRDYQKFNLVDPKNYTSRFNE